MALLRRMLSICSVFPLVDKLHVQVPEIPNSDSLITSVSTSALLLVAGLSNQRIGKLWNHIVVIKRWATACVKDLERQFDQLATSWFILLVSISINCSRLLNLLIKQKRWHQAVGECCKKLQFQLKNGWICHTSSASFLFIRQANVWLILYGSNSMKKRNAFAWKCVQRMAFSSNGAARHPYLHKDSPTVWKLGRHRHCVKCAIT